MEQGALRQTVAELSNPTRVADDLHYKVKIISGAMQVLGKDVSIFIDVIGMPLTPVSFTGTRRCAYRRVVLR